MRKEVTKECAGCGREFTVLPIEDSKSLYCTTKCEEKHSIFNNK